ncbi:MAG: glycosyltransferase family 4 protein [Pseudomonadota bacterium]
MRVLLVITRGGRGGAQAHVLELVRGLLGRVEFTVAVGEDAFLASSLRSLGVRVQVLPALRREVAPAADLRACAALRRLIRALGPDLVHTHSSKAGLLGRAAAWREGVPAMHTAHAWSFSDGLPRRRIALAVPIEALAGRATRRFITVSEADGRIARRYHVARAAQIRVVHNGIADTPWRAAPDAGAPTTIAMVARMAPPKDHHLLLRALAGVGAPFRLLLIGDGPDRGAIEAEIGALGLVGRVDLAGDSAEVPRLLAGAQIGALISRQEGFPLAVLEAMRAGLPVIASDVGGVREAIEDQATGLLVARGDATGLRSALARLLVDAPLRRRLGDAGRRAWEQRFTAAHMVSGTEAVYRELAEEGGWPPPRALTPPASPAGGSP